MSVSDRRSEAELLLQVQVNSKAAIVFVVTGRSVLIRIQRVAEYRCLCMLCGD